LAYAKVFIFAIDDIGIIGEMEAMEVFIEALNKILS